VDCGGQVENVKYLGNGKVLATRLDTKHYVLYSADYGLTWQGATFDVQPDLITCFENVGNGVVACGGYYSTGVPGAIYTSNDYGATWTRQWNTSAQGGIVALARANQNELYSVRTNGGTTIVDKMNTSDTGVNLGIDVNKKTQSTSAGGSIKFVTFGTQYGTLYFGDKQEWSGSASKLFKSVNTSHDSWAEVATGIGYLYNGISYDYNNEKVLALVETPAGAVYKFILLVTTTAELDTLVNIANSGAVGRNLEYIGKDKFIFSWQDEINTWKIGEASIATLQESGSYAFLTSCYLGTNQILLGTAESVEIKITNK
jgi:hypothetical protein